MGTGCLIVKEQPKTHQIPKKHPTPTQTLQTTGIKPKIFISNHHPDLSHNTSQQNPRLPLKDIPDVDPQLNPLLDPPLDPPLDPQLDPLLDRYMKDGGKPTNIELNKKSSSSKPPRSEPMFEQKPVQLRIRSDKPVRQLVQVRV